MLAIAVCTAALVLIPAVFNGVDREFFFLRDLALIAFNGLIIYEGLTPNRAIVLITNILVFLNLIMIAGKLYLSCFKGASAESIEKTVAGHLVRGQFY